MHKKTLNPLSSKLGLGLLFAGLAPVLSACPANPSLTTTEGTETEAGTTTDDPSNPTTTNTTPPTTDTDTPTTDTATTDNSTSGPSTDPSTSGDPTTDTTTDTTTGTQDNLCTRLGGAGDGGIKDLVTAFVGGVLLDDKINGYFLNNDVDGGALIGLVTDQLGEVAECPGVTYGGLSMLEAHAGLGISDQDFNDFAADFVTALDAHQGMHPELTDADKTAILDTLGSLKGDIVEDLTSDATVYQRVGRKPAIKGLIGTPDLTDSFVGVVAVNDAINTFFAASDFARLNTCLTRQVGGIDGPTKYGQEVDSPGAGIDEGVGVGNECRDMTSSHEMLMDADMTTITIDDFGALVGDLVTAMGTAGVAAGDQTAILDALGPLCDQIVVGAAEKNKCMGNSEDELAEAPDLALALLDDKYNGNLDTMLCTDIAIAENVDLAFVGNVQLTVGLDHPWIGDVTIKLQSPAGTVLTVLQRPGNSALPDDGTGCCNDSSDLSKDFPVTFKNGGVTNGSKMGTTIAADKIVCKDDSLCEYNPTHLKGPGVDFNDFLGEAPAGAWKVCVGDSNLKDFGTLDYIGLTVTKVKFDPKL
ncbi:proprotein convertase P-domain-containing protein [Nannocystis sp.]|uniref:proprotein convertase P-domain-containing protein n=1 Tax=Nannocystis sp. TaxID=1962667 RepID=UPI0025E1C4FF|nr:proprotein convertase P-domain-containing protein [Nannocystis sp.]MBK7826579.1 proprotein convertase P-domain-containing protein [Nannocystis sp.]